MTMDDDKQVETDLEKARILERELNDRNRTEPLKQVQAIRFDDGRHAAVMGVRKGWLEIWPLNKAVFRAGETVTCDGTDPAGNACTVYLRIGGVSRRSRKWFRARKIKAVRKITVPLDTEKSK